MLSVFKKSTPKTDALLLDDIQAATTLYPVCAHYSIDVDDKFSGQATRLLSASSEHMTLSVKAKIAAMAKAEQVAHFVIQSGQVRPLSSRTQYQMLALKRHVAYTYNGSDVLVDTGNKNQHITTDWALDDVSLEAQLRLDGLAGINRSCYPLLKKTKVENIAFNKGAIAPIELPFDQVQAYCLSRKHNDPKRKTQFWLSPELNHLPVQMRLQTGTHHVSLKLIALTKA